MSVGELFVKLGLDMSEFDDGLKKAESQSRSFGSMVKDALSTAGGILLAKGIEAAGSAMSGAVTIAADFEHALSGVSAVAGGLSGDTLEALRQKALDIGAATSLSASQAVDAFEALVANGIDPTSTSFNSIADSTVALAEATGGDLTTAANVATDTLANFKLSADDLAGAVNGIVGVTVAGKFGIDDYRLAIANAGSIAGSAGVSLTDFNTVIAGTSSNFASGSDAGTAFKTFLMGLSGNSETAKAAMRELGIITADGTNQFFTASGALKDMGDVSAILKDKIGNLTAEQQLSYIKAIFGGDAYRMVAGMIDLAGNSADGSGTKFDALAANIAKISAADQAKERLNNFSGATEALKGSLETLSIVIVGPLLEAITPLVSQIGSAVGAFAMFANSIISAGNPLQALLSAIDSVIPGFADLANQAIAWGSNIVAQFSAGIMSQLAPLVNALRQIGSVIRSWLAPGSPPAIVPELDQWGADAATVYYEGWSQGDYSALQSMGSTVQDVLKGMVDAGVAGIPKEGIIPSVLGTQSALSAAISQMRETGSVGEESIQAIVSAAGEAGPHIESLVRTFFDLEEASQAVASAQEELNAVTQQYADQLSPLNEQMKGIKAQQQQIRDKERLVKLNETLGDASATESEKAMAQLEIQEIQLRQQIDTVEDERDTAVDAAKMKLDAAKEVESQAKAAYDAQQSQLKVYNDQNNLIAQQTQLLQQLASAKSSGSGVGASGGGIDIPDPSSLMPTEPAANPLTQLLTDATNTKAAFLDMKDGISEAMGSVQTVVAPVVTAISSAFTWLQDNSELVKASFAGIGAIIVYALGPTVVTALTTAATAFAGVIAAALPIIGVFALVAGAGALIYGAFSGTLPQILAQVTNAFGGIVSYIQGALPSWMAALGGWATAAFTWVQGAYPQMLAAIGTAITQIVAYVQSQLPLWVSTLAEWARMIAQWIIDAAPVALANVSAFVGSIVGYLAENLPTWITTLMKWATSAVEWIAKAIPPLITELGKFLKAMLEWAIGTALPALVEWGIKAAAELIAWVATELIPKVAPAMGSFLVALVAALGSILAGITQAALDIGKGVIDGIIEGVKNGVGSLKDAVANAAKSALDSAKKALGIQSPSTVTRDDVGMPLVQGIIEGIGAEIPNLMAAAENLSQEFIDEATSRLDELKDKYREVFKSITDAIIGFNNTTSANARGIESLAPDTSEEEKYIADKKKLEEDLAKLRADQNKPLIESQEKIRDVEDKIASEREKLQEKLAAFDPTETNPEKIKQRQKVEAEGLARIRELQQDIVDIQQNAQGKINDNLSDQEDVQRRIEETQGNINRAQMNRQALEKYYYEALEKTQALQAKYAELQKTNPQLAAKLYAEESAQIIEKAKLQQEYQEAVQNGDGIRQRSLALQLSVIDQNHKLRLEQIRQEAEADQEKQNQSIEDIQRLAAEIGSVFRASFIDNESIGSNVAEGIANGIADNAQVISDTLLESMKSALDDLKSYLGIHSPSTVFADIIGKPSMQGWAQGIKKNDSIVADAMSNVGTATVNTAYRAGGSVAGGTSNAYTINLDLRGSTMSRQDAEKLIDTKLDKIVKTATRIR